ERDIDQFHLDARLARDARDVLIDRLFGRALERRDGVPRLGHAVFEFSARVERFVAAHATRAHQPGRERKHQGGQRFTDRWIVSVAATSSRASRSCQWRRRGSGWMYVRSPPWPVGRSEIPKCRGGPEYITALLPSRVMGSPPCAV